MPESIEEILAAAAQRTQRLMEQLASAVLVEISGLVGPMGATLSRSGQASLWTLLLELPAWQDAAGAVQAGSLFLRAEMSQEKAKERQSQIQVGSIMRFKARIVTQSLFERPEGLLVEVSGAAKSDPELTRRVSEWQRPVSYEDQKLGRLVLDRKYGWFETKVDWLGQSIDLRLSVDGEMTVEAGAISANSLWADSPHWDERIRRFSTDELLPLKNGNRLEEDEVPVTTDDFARRLKLEAIHFETAVSFSFWFGDDDLFWGTLR